MRVCAWPGCWRANVRDGVINGPDGPEIQLPLFPRMRTQVGHQAMSEKCHERSLAIIYLATPRQAVLTFCGSDALFALPFNRAF
jgi:hypothetical protein